MIGSKTKNVPIRSMQGTVKLRRVLNHAKVASALVDKKSAALLYRLLKVAVPVQQNGREVARVFVHGDVRALRLVTKEGAEPFAYVLTPLTYHKLVQALAAIAHTAKAATE